MCKVRGNLSTSQDVPRLNGFSHRAIVKKKKKVSCLLQPSLPGTWVSPCRTEKSKEIMGNSPLDPHIPSTILLACLWKWKPKFTIESIPFSFSHIRRYIKNTWHACCSMLYDCQIKVNLLIIKKLEKYRLTRKCQLLLYINKNILI